ncbi:alpha-amylase [Nanoarchaeota archaeon]|nr:MAG: alpha-amylase [Nanoarchaeota archaeon]
MIINFYFQVHQPFRLRRYTFFDIGENHDYYDHNKNKEIFLRAARKCYLPTNRLLLDLIKKHNVKVSFSIPGTFLEQAEMYNKDVIQSFQELVDTGNVSLLNETYYHSLAFLVSKQEFVEQVKMHKKITRKYFNKQPVVLRNTEAMYSNAVAKVAEEMGFKAMVTEGWDSILGWRSPNYMYKAKGSNVKLLTRNYKLSDDIGFRFSTPYWEEYPLTADKYAMWLASSPGEVINLFLDYETFGEHQWPETGIFEFLRHLPIEVAKHKHLEFATIDEVVHTLEPKDEIDIPHFLSWADIDRDLSAWLGNNMQKSAFEEIKKLEPYVKEQGGKVLEDWRKLLTSDNYYYMCTKWFADGDIHKYFNAYDSPYVAYANFMNIVRDLKHRLGLLTKA